MATYVPRTLLDSLCSFGRERAEGVVRRNSLARWLFGFADTISLENCGKIGMYVVSKALTGIVSC